MRSEIGLQTGKGGEPMYRKKMLVLYGSPHEAGTTAKLLKAFLEPFLAEEAWEIQQLSAYGLHAEPCIGCGFCKTKEACRYTDLDDFDSRLRESDLLVVASPVYCFSFPAPLKAVLDRTQRYFEARFALGKKPAIEKHRKAVLLLTMGSREEFGVQVPEYQLRRTFSVMNTELTHIVLWEGTDARDSNQAQAMENARAAALEILGEM